jgi:hypothetical protein
MSPRQGKRLNLTAINAMIALRTAPYWTAKPRVPFEGEGRPLAITHPSLAAQIRRQVDAQYPYAACDDCLAGLLIVSVDEVRVASLVVAREEGFMRRVRFCYTCRRTVELTSRE